MLVYIVYSEGYRSTEGGQAARETEAEAETTKKKKTASFFALYPP
jgi:hypothetical protein